MVFHRLLVRRATWLAYARSTQRHFTAMLAPDIPFVDQHNLNGIVTSAESRHRRSFLQKGNVEQCWVGKAGASYCLCSLEKNNAEDVVELHERIHHELEDKNFMYRHDYKHFLKLLSDSDGHSHMCGIFNQNELIAYSTMIRAKEDSEEMQAVSKAVPKGSHVAKLLGTAVCKNHRGYGFQRMMIDYRKQVAAHWGLHHFITQVAPRNIASLSSVLKQQMQVRGIIKDDEDDTAYDLVLHNDSTNIIHTAMNVYDDEEIEVGLGDIAGHRAALGEGLVGWKLVRSKSNARQCIVYSSVDALQLAQSCEEFAC